MKKIYILSFLIFSLLLTGCLENNNPAKSLTLKQAINLANSEALIWHQEARLLDATSVDNDKKIAGSNGKRRYWNITFGVPNTRDMFLVNIHDGKINERLEIPNEGDENRPYSYFINDLSKINYDSPELLKKAKKITNLYPGDIFAKGYNFGITKHPEEGLILIKIIGWDKERKNIIYVFFDGETGEFYLEFLDEQYQ